MPAGKTYVSIATTSLSTTTSSVTFNSIPQTYTDIVLTMTPVLGTNSYPYMRFNSDSGNNYTDIWINGNKSSYQGGVRTSNPRGYIAEYVTHLTDSNSKTNIIVNIFDYTETNKHKAYLVRGNSPYTGTYTGVEFMCGRWASTNAITSITIGTASGGTDYNLASGTVISLYGIARA